MHGLSGGRFYGILFEVGVISLFPAPQNVAQVEAGRAVVQLKQSAAVGRSDAGVQFGIADDHLFEPVPIEIEHFDVQSAVLTQQHFVRNVFRRDEMGVQRMAQIIEVQAAKQTMPLGAVALAPVKLPPGLIRFGVGGRNLRHLAAHMNHFFMHLVGF